MKDTVESFEVRKNNLETRRSTLEKLIETKLRESKISLIKEIE